MDKIITLSILAVLLSVVGGCSGDSVTPVAEGESSVPLNDPLQCPVPEPDFAEQLFTEFDRQWFCSVTNVAVGITDEVYFSRNGRAQMARFGEVYWNRMLSNQSVNVASPFVSPFVIRNVFSANTVLNFDLVTESGTIEAYDCVLVGREEISPELM